jgi:hypothetical protein
MLSDLFNKKPAPKINRVSINENKLVLTAAGAPRNFIYAEIYQKICKKSWNGAG